MAFPKKESKIITIDEVKYRWMVGPNDDYNYFYAQNERGEGQKIAVQFGMYIDENKIPHVTKSDLIIIKPREAELIIRQALVLGWNADEKGPTLFFRLNGDKVIKWRDWVVQHGLTVH
jgi:hypothetical protein